MVLNDPNEIDFERIEDLARRAVIVAMRDYHGRTISPSSISIFYEDIGDGMVQPGADTGKTSWSLYR